MAKQWRPTARTACLTALLLWSAASCGGPGASPARGDEPLAGETAGASPTEAIMPDSAIIAAQEELTKTVMALPGVTGTAVGLCGDTVCIKVYLTRRDETVMEQIPETFLGFSVDIEVTGEFRAREGGTSR